MELSRRVTGAILLTAGFASGAIWYKTLPQRRAMDEAYAKAEAELAKWKAAQAAKPATAGPTVVALWTGKPIPGEPMGVHVADVGVDNAGAVTLLLADNAQTRATVEAALVEARAQPALTVPVSTTAAPGTAPAAARPGEPQYAEAVADFLSSKTGFKPQVQR